MRPNLQAMVRALVAALVIPFAGCGASDRDLPTGITGAPTPSPPATPTPVPTPTPRVTATLDVPSDSGRYSPQLAVLNSNSSIEINFTLKAVNSVAGETFGHAIEFWLLADASVPVDLEKQADLDSGFSLVENNPARTWNISSVNSRSGYTYTPNTVRISAGEQHTVRVRRTPQGSAEYFLDGQSVMELPNPLASRRVFIRAYATSVEYSYLPGVFGLDHGAEPQVNVSPARIQPR